MRLRSPGLPLLSACALLLAVVSLQAQAPVPASGSGPRMSAAAHAAAMFTHSDNCVACHNQLTTSAGEDVSIGTSWRSTIMANAARDPYFLASVRRETVDHPKRADEIQDECATCHVPIAQKAARAAGRHAVLLASLEPGGTAGTDVDHLSSDGVTCTVCHQIASDTLGSAASFNGNFVMRPARSDGVRDVFGPFGVDKGRHTIMRSVTGYEQVEAPHVRQSELCASCHTLITQAFDRDGRVIGSLPEQMNYQEWRHSAFYDEGRSCQSCHMPRAAGPVKVSSVLGAERDGLSRHVFLGGNAFMLRLLNRFRSELGVEAPPAALEATARLTEQQLRHDTAAVAVTAPTRTGDAVEFDVVVNNLTGHKFPTGYPARRTWLHVTVTDPMGRVMFESGAVSKDGAIAGNDSDVDSRRFEPHYDVIDRPDQVEIYESIMGTVDSQPTTGLLSAVKYLKDNRLLPRGFDKRTAAAEVGVFGDALGDSSFVGGADRVRYRVDARDGRRVAKVAVELLYQPIAYRWANNLSGYGGPEPERFSKFFGQLSSTASTQVATASWQE